MLDFQIPTPSMIWYLYLLYSIAGILAVIIIFLFGLLIYVKLTAGKCKSHVKLHGKTTIVTGANTGIGYETALYFAARGAKVILACRSQQKGQEAVDRIIKKTNNTNVLFKQLDLSSLNSVRQFAEEIIKSQQKLDILVNNAGAYGLPTTTTEDGLILLMQTNYFGPFLLTILLLDIIKRTPNARIVNVSSVLANYTRNFDVNDLNHYPQSGIMKNLNVYGRSKLCNILFTIKLAEDLKNTSVTTYSLHPGGVRTEIARDPGLFQRILSKTIYAVYLKSPRQGAETTIYCSIAEGIENLSGQHFEDCHVVKRYKKARSPDLPEKLWKETENLLKLN